MSERGFPHYLQITLSTFISSFPFQRYPSAERHAHTLPDVHHYLSLELHATSKQYKAHTDQHHLVAPTFAVGDMVLLLRRDIATTGPCAKLNYKKLGLFNILEHVNPVTFQLVIPPTFWLFGSLV